MGKIGEIISYFKDQTSLPIDVNEVLAQVKSTGITAEVEFIGVELDTLILRGKYRLFEWPTGMYTHESTLMANIYYHINDTVDWQRFVCCKEITHLLDGPNYHTPNREDQVELAKQVGLPPHLRDPFKSPVEASIDVVAELFALALLLPISARNSFADAIKVKKLTSKDVAIIADIPEHYVEMALSPGWAATHEKLLEL